MYIISPFKSVIYEFKQALMKQFKENYNYLKYQDIKEWVDSSCGTVHTFQGKEANEVIMLLGCDDESGIGAANWAGKKPNILNVAVTRAKYRFIIIGDYKLWSKVPYFYDAYEILK